VIVIAIFHLIIGGFGLMCDLCGAASLVAGGGQQFSFNTDPKQKQMEKQMQDIFTRDLPAYTAIQVLEKIVGLALDVALICAGIGLLQMARWGRTLSIGYGAASLIYHFLSAVYVIVYVIPAFDTIMQAALSQARTAQDRQAVELGLGFMKGAMLGATCLPLIYPFIVLLVMGLPSVKVAFAAGGQDNGDDGWAPRGPGVPPENPGPLGGYGGPDDRYAPPR